MSLIVLGVRFLMPIFGVFVQKIRFGIMKDARGRLATVGRFGYLLKGGVCALRTQTSMEKSAESASTDRFGTISNWNVSAKRVILGTDFSVKKIKFVSQTSFTTQKWNSVCAPQMNFGTEGSASRGLFVAEEESTISEPSHASAGSALNGTPKSVSAVSTARSGTNPNSNASVREEQNGRTTSAKSSSSAGTDNNGMPILTSVSAHLEPFLMEYFVFLTPATMVEHGMPSSDCVFVQKIRSGMEDRVFLPGLTALTVKYGMRQFTLAPVP